jgi:hypothetical protein
MREQFHGAAHLVVSMTATLACITQWIQLAGPFDKARVMSILRTLTITEQSCTQPFAGQSVNGLAYPLRL